MIKGTKLGEGLSDQGALNNAVETLSKQVAVRAEGDSLFEISATMGKGDLTDAENAVLARNVVQKLLDIFREENIAGKIESANGGTLFLDEVGDIPLPLQVKLLRFLQECTIERIGGRKTIAVDTRIVCATHQNLEAMITEGAFREDLFYRLAEIVVRIPGLAERHGDAVLLGKAFLKRFSCRDEPRCHRFCS